MRKFKMKNYKGESSGRLLAAMLAFNFKSKLTLGDHGMGTKKPMLRGIFISSEAMSFDRERRQRRQKLILTLKETLEDLEKIKESLGDSRGSLACSDTEPVGSQETPEIFPHGLSRTENTQSFAELAILTQNMKTPLTSTRRKSVQRISKSTSRMRPSPLVVLESGQYYGKNRFNVHLKLPNGTVQSGIKRINVRLSEVRRILSSLDCSTMEKVLLDLPVRLKFCWEGLTEKTTSKVAIQMVPVSPSVVVKNSEEFFERITGLPVVEQGLDATNGELWATINSSFMGSEQVTPTSDSRALIQGCSTNSKKSMKRKKFNNGFIATTARRLFSTSSPLSLIKQHREISAVQRNFELQFEEIVYSTETSEHQKSSGSEVIPSTELTNEDSNILSRMVALEDRSTMDTSSFLESATVQTNINETQLTTQSECSTQTSKITLEVAVQTDFVDVSSLKEESFYEQTPLIPEVNKVGLMVGSVPDAFKKLQTIAGFLEPYGVVGNISIKQKKGWIGFFASYELQANNETALLGFMEKPFGKNYLRQIVNAKLGTYGEFLQSSPKKPDESLEFVNALLKRDYEEDDVDGELHLLKKVGDLFGNLPIDVSIESISRLLSIFNEEKKSMRKHLVYKVEAIILSEARSRVRYHRKKGPVVSTSKFWQDTFDRLCELFVRRFRRNPVEIIDLLPSIADLEMISKFLSDMQQIMDSSSPINKNLQPVYANFAQICSRKLPASTDVLEQMCETLITHLRRYATDRWAAELITNFGSTDHLKRVCNVFEYKLENLTREGFSPLLDCTLVFCNQSRDRLFVGFASILEGLLNIEALTFKQIGSIFTCELAQVSFETFCRLLSDLMEKLSSNKNACEKWILIARMMPQWVGSNDSWKRRRNVLVTSTNKILSMLEVVSATYKLKPVQENWTRETRFLDAWRRLNQHNGCPGCLELRDFLRNPAQISSNITVNDAGRKCVKKILSSYVDGSATKTLATHLNLVFEELDFSQNMKLYNSRRCGAIDVRKNPLSSAQSQFRLQWFDDAKLEIQAIAREIEQTPQISEDSTRVASEATSTKINPY